VVDELLEVSRDAEGEGAGAEDEDVALDLESSAFGAVADDSLELLDLSPGLAWVALWALDELSVCWAMPAPTTPRIMNVLRTPTKRDFFMVHLPEGAERATAMPATRGNRS
jgi:hypothetical protein